MFFILKKFNIKRGGQMENKILFGIILVGLIIIGGVIWLAIPKIPNQNYVNNYGQSQQQSNILTAQQNNLANYLLPKQDVEGKDLPCIGKPQNYIRMSYNREDEDGYITTTLEYYSPNGDINNLKNWIIQKAQQCGFNKQSESINQGAIGGAQTKEIDLDFETPDHKKTLLVRIGQYSANSMKYTAIELSLEESP